MINIFSLTLLQKIIELSFFAAFFLRPFSIAGMEIFFIISFTSLLIYKLLSKEPLAENQTVFLTLGLFAIFSSISAFHSGYPMTSIRGIWKLIRYASIMLVAMYLFKEKNRGEKFLKVNLLCSGLVALDSFIQLIASIDPINHFPIYHTSWESRLTGPYKFYGLLAAHAIAILPILFVITIKEKIQEVRFTKIFRFVLSLIFFITGLFLLYKTQSRGAWLASIVGWLAYGMLMKNKWIFIVIFVVAIATPFVLPRYLLIHQDFQQNEQSIKERYQLWYRAIQVIQKEPLFGCGINTYVKNYDKYDKKKHWRVPGYYVHNGYLQVAAESGLIALALFLFIIGQAFKSGLASFKNAIGIHKNFIAALISGFIALLFQAFVDTTLHDIQSAAIIWLYIGILFASKTSAR